MAGSGSGFSSPLAWWGEIQRGSQEGYNVQQMWQAIHQASVRDNLAEPPDLLAQVNKLWHAANTLRSAERVLARSPDDYAVTADVIGQLPYGRPGESQAVVQQYIARVRYGIVVGGEQGSGWVSIPMTTTTLPSTIGEMRARAEEAAGAYATKYGIDYVGVESIQIGAL